MLCNVKLVVLSPVPFKPITIPYPSSWLVLIPAIETKSFNLSAKRDCENKFNSKKINMIFFFKIFSLKWGNFSKNFT